MRIWFLSIEFSIGTFSGNGIYAISQARALANLGHRITVVCGRPSQSHNNNSNSSETPINNDRIDIITIELPTWGTLTDDCAYLEYARGASTKTNIDQLIQFNPDIILGVDWHSAPAYESIADALRARKNVTVPPFAFANYRVYHRSALGSNDGALFRRIEGLALRHSIYSTVLSRSDVAYVRQYFAHCLPESDPAVAAFLSSSSAAEEVPTHHVQVLLPALRSDMESIPPFNQNQQHRRFLLCACRASPEKEPERYVDLVIALHKRGVLDRLNITPVVLGAGWDAESNAQLRDRLTTSVPSTKFIKGFLGPNDLAEIYSQTLLNVHSPVYDAYGMTIVEAASQGAPTVVAGTHVGATDLLKPTENEIVTVDFANSSLDTVADKIQDLLENKQEYLINVGLEAMKKARQWTEQLNAATLISSLQAALDREILHIDQVSAKELSVEEFRVKYLSANIPVLITDIVQYSESGNCDWLAATDWVDRKSGGKVNIEFLKARLGASKVYAAEVDTSRGEAAGYGEGNCREMTVAEYCDWWQQHKQESSDRPSTLLYLKDWHFVNEYPEYKAYKCPEYFEDDWLNEWYDYKTALSTGNESSRGDKYNTAVTTSDYRFVYLGPRGTKTPLHADVLRSHSWSVNVIGVKKWRLLHPRHAHLLLDTTGTHTALDFQPHPGSLDTLKNTSSTTTNYTTTQRVYPGLEEAYKRTLEVIQPAGSALFVPSGWWHTVENLEDTLSINHNWFEGHAVKNSWEYLKAERSRAAELIEDCRQGCSEDEFEALVQRNCAANAGMDFEEFGSMLRYIATKASTTLYSNNNDDMTVPEYCLWWLMKAGEILFELRNMQRTLGPFQDAELGGLNDECIKEIAKALKGADRELPWDEI